MPRARLFAIDLVMRSPHMFDPVELVEKLKVASQDSHDEVAQKAKECSRLLGLAEESSAALDRESLATALASSAALAAASLPRVEDDPKRSKLENARERLKVYEGHRDRLFKEIKTALDGRGSVIAGTGSNSTAEAVSATKDAEKIGVDGCLLVVPYYNKPTQEGLYQHFRFIAGGTDIIVNKFQGNDSSSCLIDLTGIGELKLVEKFGKHLKIGSGVALDNLKDYPEIEKGFPVLLEAACAVASPVIRKTATIGGNILCENRCTFYNQSEWWREAVGYCLKCNGDICIATGGKKKCFSKFVSDMAIALISLDAYIEVIEYGGSSISRLEDIYTGDGINPRKFNKTALIKALHIPLNEGNRSIFKKLRQRESMEFSSLTTVLNVNKYGKIKIVLGGVDPRPIIIEGSPEDDKQELIRQVIKKARIIDNDVFSREYRKEMITVFLNRSFNELQSI